MKVWPRLVIVSLLLTACSTTSSTVVPTETTPETNTLSEYSTSVQSDMVRISGLLIELEGIVRKIASYNADHADRERHDEIIRELKGFSQRYQESEAPPAGGELVDSYLSLLPEVIEEIVKWAGGIEFSTQGDRQRYFLNAQDAIDRARDIVENSLAEARRIE